MLFAWVFFFSYLTWLYDPQLDTVSTAFKSFLCLNKDKIKTREEKPTTVSAGIASVTEAKADTKASEEANISPIDKCLIGHFENPVSCMQMQMSEKLFTV